VQAPKTRWDEVESPSRFKSLFELIFSQKPLHTFLDHALDWTVSNRRSILQDFSRGIETRLADWHSHVILVVH